MKIFTSKFRENYAVVWLGGYSETKAHSSCHRGLAPIIWSFFDINLSKTKLKICAAPYTQQDDSYSETPKVSWWGGKFNATPPRCSNGNCCRSQRNLKLGTDTIANNCTNYNGSLQLQLQIQLFASAHGLWSDWWLSCMAESDVSFHFIRYFLFLALKCENYGFLLSPHDAFLQNGGKTWWYPNKVLQFLWSVFSLRCLHCFRVFCRFSMAKNAGQIHFKYKSY